MASVPSRTPISHHYSSNVHQNNVFHNDLRIENVFFDEARDTLLIIDYDTARTICPCIP